MIFFRTNSDLKFFYLGALLSIIVLTSLSLFGFRNFKRTETTAKWVNHTMEVIARLQTLEASVLELANNQRGFIITGHKSYLEKFKLDSPHLIQDLAKIEQMILDNPIQQRNIVKLGELIIQKQTFSDDSMNLVQLGKKNQAEKLVSQGRGQELTNEIEKLIIEMRKLEEKLLSKRLRENKRVHENANLIILVSSILALFIITIGIYLIRRQFIRRMKIQSDLNNTTQVQKAMLQSAAFALIAGDLNGKTTLFNPAAEELLGYKAEEILGRLPSIFHVPEEVAAMAEKLSARFNEKIPVGYDVFIYRALRGIIETDNWTYIRKDGKKVPVRLTVTMLRNENGESTGYLGIAYDISQQLEYEKAIISAKESALAGNKAKSEFLANMSHEIRTPMNAIMGMAELLQETELDDEQRKYVEIFSRAGDSLLNLINDILDLSKIEAGHFELDHASFSLCSLVEKVTEIMALKAHQKQLELMVDIEDSLHDTYFGDGNRIRQILLNLVGNAVKFTKRGDIILHIYGGKNIYNKKEIIIEVQDSGIGMTPEQVSKLFERFAQADSSITKEYGGTGLGLNITKRLLDLMGGSINVQSTMGIGTRFTITIPLELDHSVDEPNSQLNLECQRVLIVDDSKTNRMIVRKMVEKLGALTSEAESGDVALKIVTFQNEKKEPFDLILLDYRMPGLDGFQVAQSIKKETPTNGPLLMMLTSDNRPGDMAKAKSLGLNSYLVKPILKKDLLNALEKAMNGHQSAQEKIPVKQESINQEQLRIMLVDDNDENRLVIMSFLKKYPWKIDQAKHGKEALLLFNQNSYDLILMDMQMPVMDGYSATEEIRRIESKSNLKATPILALSAYALKEEMDRSFLAGCNDHLTKPIGKTKLLEAIDKYTKSYEVELDPDLSDLISEYLENRKKEILTLWDAKNASDWNSLSAIGHRLKGSAGSYGFDELSLVGKDLEDGGKAKDMVKINQALSYYQLLLNKLKIRG